MVCFTKHACGKIIEVMLSHLRKHASHARRVPEACPCRRVAGGSAERLHRVGVVSCMAFSRDGRLLALGGQDGSIQVLEWPSLRAHAELRCVGLQNPQPPMLCALGSRLLECLGFADPSARSLHLACASLTSGACSTLAASCGRPTTYSQACARWRVLIGDNLDVTGPQNRGERGLPDGVRDVDFSAGHHNRVLCTTCEDGSCVLWEWEKGEQITRLALPAGGWSV